MTVVLLDIAALAQAPIEGNRAHLNGDRVGYYLTHLDQAPPVVVFDTGAELLLADGYHRVAAAQQLGRGTIRAQVRRGTPRDALAFAVSLGVDQRGVTADEVRAAIRRRGDTTAL
jgi:hypothetical protein